ncbi:MAG: sulfotransferase [Anaerolineaceae bacterium]|nr:sulfotransferase [Anaerolineaceae bacterium]
MTLKRYRKLILDTPPRQLIQLVRQRALKANRREDFDALHPAVFTLSTGRTGTETLAALLELAPNVFSYHEPAPILYGLSRQAYDSQPEWSANPAIAPIFVQAFLTARRQLLDYALDCGRGYVETSPQVTFLAPFIQQALPAARFIVVTRNPQEVVRSGMRRNWYAGNKSDATRIHPRPGTDTASAWETFSTFQKNAWLWAETNRYILDWAATVPAEQVLQVRAEDVFRGDSATTDRLFRFIQSPLPAPERIQRVLGLNLNSQKSGSFPKASDWSDEMRQQFDELTGEVRQTLGYD